VGGGKRGDRAIPEKGGTRSRVEEKGEGAGTGSVPIRDGGKKKKEGGALSLGGERRKKGGPAPPIF